MLKIIKITIKTVNKKKERVSWQCTNMRTANLYSTYRKSSHLRTYSKENPLISKWLIDSHPIYSTVQYQYEQWDDEGLETQRGLSYFSGTVQILVDWTISLTMKKISWKQQNPLTCPSIERNADALLVVPESSHLRTVQIIQKFMVDWTIRLTKKKSMFCYWKQIFPLNFPANVHSVRYCTEYIFENVLRYLVPLGNTLAAAGRLFFGLYQEPSEVLYSNTWIMKRWYGTVGGTLFPTPTR